jgi:NAD(P)-dependent dehydrogenase (short-subunit alcohol dehydrogenase family)
MAERAVADAGGVCDARVVDVRDSDGVREALDAVPALSGLVHVAGGLHNRWSPLVETTQETFAAIVQDNLHSAFLTTRAAARRMIQQESGGSIVHIASVAGVSALPYGAGYAAAKAAMLSLTRTAALELGRANIRVNAVAPGTVRTPASGAQSTDVESGAEQAAVPLRRRGLPDDIAYAVVFLLSDLAGWITGQVLAVDGGSSARPSFLGDDDLPVFVHDDTLRARLRAE